MHDAAPYQVHLDQETAQRLAQAGSALLILNVPAGTQLGIDTQCFTVGPRFLGVKMMPPGPHLITYRAVSIKSHGQQQPSVSPTTGFFLQASPLSVHVYRWDPATEMIVQLADSEEAERYAAGVRRMEFDSGLAPYNLALVQTWKELTSCLSPSVIDRLMPVSGSISIMAESSDADLSAPRTPAEKRLVEQLKAGRHKPQPPQQQQPSQQPPADVEMEPVAEQIDQQQEEAGSATGIGQQAQSRDAGGAPGTSGRCFYTQLPKLLKHKGASAAELTAMNMDKSTILRKVLQEHYEGQLEPLLGELQFSFLAFVYVQSLDGYVQWKQLLLLLLGCEDAALHSHQDGFVKVLRTLRYQLASSTGHDPEAVHRGGHAHTASGIPSAADVLQPFGVSMVEELLPDSFLRRMFGSFFDMLRENGEHVGGALFNEANSLKAVLRVALGWEYDLQVMGGGGAEGLVGVDDDEDEDGPVLVEHPEQLVAL